MYLHYLISLLLTNLIVLIEAYPSLQPDFVKRDKFQAENNNVVSLSRLPNSSTAAYTEARAGGSSVSSLNRFKNMFLTSKVTPEKLENWLKQGKSADVVFERLHLHAVGRRLFNEPQFNAWVQYADELSVKVPGMSAISTLTRQYGDEVLFRMIETAKKSSDTESLATKLETQQMQHWLRSRKDPDEVFHLFEVDNLWGNILKKTEFTAWSKYVDNLNTNYPEEPMWMYATLSKRYDDEVLFKMIKEAKLVEEYKTIAIKLEDEWFQVGLQRRKIPYKALIDLGLGKSRNTLVGQLMDEKSLAKFG